MVIAYTFAPATTPGSVGETRMLQASAEIPVPTERTA
jgi:hypothetical protein